MKGFIGGIPVALLAVAAQAKFAERHEHDFHPQAGGTAIGGPSGNDDFRPQTGATAVNGHSGHGDFHPQAGGTAIGGPSGNDGDDGFVSPYSANIKTDTKVNQWNKDDHSIKLKHTDVYPRPPVAPVPFGHPGVPSGPQVPGMGPFGKGKRGAPGGTAIGGPSGNDEGQSFDMSVTGIFNTEVEDVNKDDHSIDVKNKHVHPVAVVHPPPQFNGPPRGGYRGPAGPPSAGFNTPPGAFGKRFGPPHAGGTAIGGPSGNDGGQSFSAPTYIQTDTNVKEHNEDDHSIKLKHEDIYPRPHGHGFVPFRRSENHGPPGHGGAPPPGHFEPHAEPHFEPHTESHFEPHSEPHYEPHPEPHFENHPEPHFENHPEPHYAPHYSPSYEPHYEPHTTVEHELTSLKNNNNGPSAGSIAFGRRGFPGGPSGPGGPGGPGGPESHFEPHSEPHFEPHTESHYEPHSEPHYAPHPEPHFENHPEPHVENHPEPHYEPHYSPSYEPHYEPHTTLDYELTSLKNNNNGPSAGSIAFGRRAYAPTPETSVGGGTAIGGPSGNDGGSGFSTPTNIDLTTGVNEHNEDNHAIKGDFTHVHPDAPAEYSREDHVDAPECAAQVHEVVHTVTKTQYKTAEATHMAYQSAPVVDTDPFSGYAPQESFTPVPYADYPQHSAGADPYASPAPAPSNFVSGHPSYPVPAGESVVRAHAPMATPVASSSADYENYPQHPVGADPYAASASAPYNYASQRPSYSKIAVHVPMATPASNAAPSNSMGKMIPTGASAEQKASPSSSASASVSHGIMFQGNAARVSGGIVSAAAAVMGVLAFIL
ncbi:hypothetical protein CBS147330_6846 [Penicillium roqueforti]|nr:hypothetical protein CBS147330_6846 [Penicillium roqueforti]